MKRCAIFFVGKTKSVVLPCIMNNGMKDYLITAVSPISTVSSS